MIASRDGDDDGGGNLNIYFRNLNDSATKSLSLPDLLDVVL